MDHAKDQPLCLVEWISRDIWVSTQNRGGKTPQIIHFNRVFHYKPSILGYPYFWKHPYSPSGTFGSNPTGSPPSCMTTDSSLAPLDQDWKAWHVVLEADSGQQKYARSF